MSPFFLNGSTQESWWWEVTELPSDTCFPFSAAWMWVLRSHCLFQVQAQPPGSDVAFQGPCASASPHKPCRFPAPTSLCLIYLHRLPATPDAQANLVSFCSSFLVCFIRATKVPHTDDYMLCGARCKMNVQDFLFRKQRNNAIKGTKAFCFSSGVSRLLTVPFTYHLCESTLRRIKMLNCEHELYHSFLYCAMLV